MTDDAIAALLHAFVKALRNAPVAPVAVSLCVTHTTPDGAYVAQSFAGGSAEGIAACIATAHKSFHENFDACPLTLAIGEPASDAPGVLQ
jgi:hypothetical protein